MVPGHGMHGQMEGGRWGGGGRHIMDDRWRCFWIPRREADGGQREDVDRYGEEGGKGAGG